MFLTFALFLSGAVPPVFAQVPDTALSLAGALQLLQQRSPDYRAALAAADAAAEDVWSAWGALLPTATLGAAFTQNDFTNRTFLDPTGISRELADPVTSSRKVASQFLSIRWRPFVGGRKYFDVSASRAQARAADLAAEATRVRLSAAVRRTYFEALKQQELARLAEDLLEARRRELEIARLRFRIAAVARTDVLQAEIEVGRQELGVLRARQAANASRRALSALLGLHEDSVYALGDTLILFDPGTLDPAALLQRAERGHPDLSRLDAEVDARARSLWAARGTWWPTVDLSLTFDRSEVLGPSGEFFNFDPDNTGTSYRLSVSYPLFDGFRKKYETGRESARLQEARQRRRARTLELRKAVRDAYEALVTVHRAVQLQRRNVGLAREAVRLARERYRLGASSYVELQQATTRATGAERGWIAARYDFMKSLADLEAAVGRRLEVPR